MNTTIDFPERLADCLRGLDLASATVRVAPADYGKYKYFGVVVSRSFEGMNEAERQGVVWQRILDTLNAEDRQRIEFIYTDTPAERPELVGSA